MTAKPIGANEVFCAISDAASRKLDGTASVLPILHALSGTSNEGEMLPDAVKGALQALRRAAVRARQVAEQTGTDLIVVRSGQVVRVPPQSKTTP
ncbi:MAG: hypothetical protein Q8O29_07620 [Polaromonas sp.]|uniref:hypothetical protein n=1 Tax=Polaromonas sp. TaxID=1869339 RepID=UPI0027344299|nr:hypothetical protein [Polaromonas sp.]MDP2818138.1 hypothetical protein [Polaromonas sp.]